MSHSDSPDECGSGRNDDAGRDSGVSGAAFILVHGGQHDGRCWRHVQELLKAPSVAPDLPYRHASGPPTPAMSEAVDAICEQIATLPADRVILVGHSMAGLMMPAIARRSPKVIHAVYIAAASPRRGPTITLAEYLAREFPWYRPERQILSIWRLINPEKTINLFTARPGLQWLSYFFLSLPRSLGAERREVVKTLGPEPNWRMDIDTDPTNSGEQRTYIAAGRDRVARPYVVARAKDRLGPNITLRTIPSAGHAVMVSHPSAVATILNEILDASIGPRHQSTSSANASPERR